MPNRNNYAFIDGTNLHLTYESEELDWFIDYEKLRNYLYKRLNVEIAYYFLGKTNQNDDIIHNLESYGYAVKLKLPTYFIEDETYCPYCWGITKPEISRHKSDCDSFMTMEVMDNLRLFEQAVIITSDGDFDTLIGRLVRENKLRLLFAPCRKGCSNLLIKAANRKVAFMDDFRKELEKI